MSLSGRRILLVITGGIAAYKSLTLIRRLRQAGATVRCILTQGGANFVTPLAVQTLSGERVFMDTFSLTDEQEIGHITLAKECDLVVVAPATANILAKMATGLADDLASTALLATQAPILIAPAMNVRMWTHPATQANLATLQRRGIITVGPEEGALAEGETAMGRMSEPDTLLSAVESFFAAGPLSGRHVIVTSGPTHEPIDPVRYIGNRSSGKQGHAIAAALVRAGAQVTLVRGPVALPDPAGCDVVAVDTAVQMRDAVLTALPADAVVCAAAVADWAVADPAAGKQKKDGAGPPALTLVENPDILATVSALASGRPALVVGFAAETSDLVAHAVAKRSRKGCDWILANDVAARPTFGADDNQITFITGQGVTEWPPLSKTAVAARLVDEMVAFFAG